MSKPNKKRYRLSEVRAQYAEAVGGENVEFEGPGGEIYTMPHPLFAPKEWKEAVDEADDDEGQARAMLGEEQWAKFDAAGGDPTDLSLLNMALREDMQGSLKNGRPTRSSTSSASTRKR
ncbi:hypothetical protein ABZ369_06425 [Streptomyces sp. NPDC005918]|uniref:hypothetical protein n=1 Tax=Streptomyces sp. NPDC005918 TaxID=3155454 RepID=UPI0033EE9D44